MICPRARYDGDPRKLTPAQQKRFGCTDLNKAGQTARVMDRTTALVNTPVDFAGSFCGSEAGLCSVTAVADSSPLPAVQGALDPNNPALCYVNQD